MWLIQTPTGGVGIVRISSMFVTVGVPRVEKNFWEWLKDLSMERTAEDTWSFLSRMMGMATMRLENLAVYLATGPYKSGIPYLGTNLIQHFVMLNNYPLHFFSPSIPLGRLVQVQRT
jgi:hypothetical protein